MKESKVSALLETPEETQVFEYTQTYTLEPAPGTSLLAPRWVYHHTTASECQQTD